MMKRIDITQKGGHMKKLAIIISLLLVSTSLCSCGYNNISASNRDEDSTITVYCAAGLKKIMTTIAKDYEEATGINVQFVFNGSGMLLNQITTTGICDIYMPSDSSFVDQLEETLGQDSLIYKETLFNNVPVILVNKNAKNQISQLSDLTNSGLSLGFGEKSVAIGRMTQVILSKNKMTNEVNANTDVYFSTVTQVVTAVEMHQIDAGIAFYINYIDCDQDKVEMITIPDEANDIKEVIMCVPSISSNQEGAKAFIDYVLSEGSAVYEPYVYK